jgi:hypothetical protein
MRNHRLLFAGLGAIALALLGSASSGLRAHCDGLDGPVVHAATRALATRNVNFALIWVQPKDEPEIRAAFAETLAVRLHGARAQRLADRAFFETLVRLHRAGEGAPYQGVKPAGRDLGPAIPAADRAVTTDSLTDLEDLLVAALRGGLKERFDRLRAARTFSPDDLTAGRAYVAVYVEYMHYAERLYDAAVHDAPAITNATDGPVRPDGSAAPADVDGRTPPLAGLRLKALDTQGLLMKGIVGFMMRLR